VSMGAGKPHLAIVKSRYRPEIIDGLFQGAVAVLEQAGATHEVVEVSGSLEIPAAVSFLEKSGKTEYDGYVVLGCILKGDTIHDEVIAYTVFGDLDHMACRRQLAIGNGILTVNTVAQAEERADPKRQNRGGEAAKAALTMAELRKKCDL
jgi:6,7-dimethyl-8-ribityllumazine synthase